MPLPQQVLYSFLKSRKNVNTKKYTEKIILFLSRDGGWVRSHDLLEGVNKSLKTETGQKIASIPESSFYKLLGDLEKMEIVKKQTLPSEGVGGSAVSYQVSTNYPLFWFLTRDDLIERINDLTALYKYRRTESEILKKVIEEKLPDLDIRVELEKRGMPSLSDEPYKAHKDLIRLTFEEGEDGGEIQK